MVWSDGNVYASGDGLSKYDPLTQTFSYLGKFPGNVFSAGDLIEYNNKMYMSSSEGDIYEININAPDLSTLYFKVGVTGIFGMIVISIKCSNQPALQQRVIAFENTGLTSRAYLIDMENKIVFPDYCNPQVSIVGGTSIKAAVVLGDPILIQNIGSTSPYCNQIGDGMISLSMFPSLVNKYVFSIDNMPDTKKSVFKNLGAGLHHIRIKNQFGCYLDTSVVISPANFECLDSVFVPSAFTPNGDGLNDIFKAISFLPVTNFEMKIYNRYGQNIYTTFSLNDGWNGKLRFIPQPSGVFVWLLRYTNFSGKNIFKKGFVTLIR
jgi:gliding motility-associated-like protein